MSGESVECLEIQSYRIAPENMMNSGIAGRRVLIARYGQIDGPDKWAVQRMSEVLNKNGHWEYEPIPSSRDDAYLERCRFDTAQEALNAYNKRVEK